ncbi:MAG: hypothetical protein RLZZ584_4058 [Pseudomonadota bacterium]|jgi:hypothetical protein
MLARLIYVSEAAEAMTPADVDAILKTARQRNKLRDITGMLVFDRRAFLQVIEGDAQHLTDLYGRIAQDPRHRRLRLLQFGALAERQFGDWSMGFAGSGGTSRRVLMRYTASSAFAPYELDAAAALALLVALARTESHAPAAEPELAAAGPG